MSVRPESMQGRGTSVPAFYISARVASQAGYDPAKQVTEVTLSFSPTTARSPRSPYSERRASRPLEQSCSLTNTRSKSPPG